MVVSLGKRHKDLNPFRARPVRGEPTVTEEFSRSEAVRPARCAEVFACVRSGGVVLLLQRYNTLSRGNPMANEFGELLQARRAELRLSLRDCAERAEMDPGNLSRIERGRATPPQDADVLARLIAAVELTGTARGQELMDVAATQNGRIPRDILSNEEVMSALPVLLRTVNNKQLDKEHIEKLVDMIKNA